MEKHRIFPTRHIAHNHCSGCITWDQGVTNLIHEIPSLKYSLKNGFLTDHCQELLCPAWFRQRSDYGQNVTPYRLMTLLIQSKRQKRTSKAKSPSLSTTFQIPRKTRSTLFCIAHHQNTTCCMSVQKLKIRPVFYHGCTRLVPLSSSGSSI